MNDTVQLSVLMSVFNGQRYIRNAIESVLTQSFKNFEFIIINDGSTDETGLILKEFTDNRIRLLNFSVNKGISSRRQQLIELAKGELICFIDADDFIHPDKFIFQVNFLKNHPDYAMVGTSAILVDEKGKKIKTLRLNAPAEKIRAILLFRNYFVNSAVMFRKSALENINIPPDFDFIEDYYLWWNILKTSKGKNLNRPLTFYRIHTESMTNYYQSTRYDINKKIYAIMFRDIGMTVDEHEFQLHFFISQPDAVNSRLQLDNLSEWFEKLKTHLKRYSIKKYNSVLLNRWLKICFKSIYHPSLFAYSCFLLIFRHKFFLFR